MLYYSDRHSRTERAHYCYSLGIGRVVSGRSAVTRRDQLHGVGVPSPPDRLPTLHRYCWTPEEARHRTPTTSTFPPSPMGGPRARNDYVRPYVLEFFGGCVDIRASFLCFFPSWGLFAPENVLLQASCKVKSPFGVTKKLPLVWILANLQLFFAFAVFLHVDAVYPQGLVSLPPALCYLK
jgi:hypothetical protein